MATRTSFLGMTLPQNNEYQNTWDSPLNADLAIIDAWAQGVSEEIETARNGFPSLYEFLNVSIKQDGTLQPTEEVVKARNSVIYGDETEEPVDFELSNRLQLSDLETFNAREGELSLRDAMGSRFGESCVVRGSKDGNGYPNWMGYTGTNVNISGTPSPLVMLINGRRCRVRDLKQVLVSGAFGTKYIYATRSDSGVVIVDGDSTTPPPATPTGTCGSDGTKVRIFEDLTVNFTLAGVVAGDILTILGTNGNAGQYVIKTVAPDGNNNRLQIIGVFPVGALASLDYTITDLFGVTLGFDDTKSEAVNKMYIGEADWDGFAVTAVRSNNFGDVFVGEWRPVDVSSSSTFTESWNHNLMDDALEVIIQASQENDGTAPVEQLSLASLTNSLGIDVVNSLTLTPGDQTLGGGISVNLTGSLYPDRSVFAQWTKYKIDIKNAQASVFYKDYSGAIKQTGYVRVILRKRLWQ